MAKTYFANQHPFHIVLLSFRESFRGLARALPVRTSPSPAVAARSPPAGGGRRRWRGAARSPPAGGGRRRWRGAAGALHAES
jgi:hypothetical protein